MTATLTVNLIPIVTTYADTEDLIADLSARVRRAIRHCEPGERIEVTVQIGCEVPQ